MSTEEMTHEQLKIAYEIACEELSIFRRAMPTDARFQLAKAAMQGLLANEKCVARMADVADEIVGWDNSKKDAALAGRIAAHATLIGDALLAALAQEAGTRK